MSNSELQKDVTIAIIQFDPIWEQPLQNLDRISHLISTVNSTDVDMIILPEMCTTGFSMNAVEMGKYTEQSITRFRALAKKHKKIICCSLIIEEYGQYFNRFFAFFPTATSYTYDKRHLFTFANEHNHYSRGTERGVFEVNGWRFFPFICYDVRFPVWLRNNQNYDAILGVANFPETRIDAWTTLLKARAIENLSYAIGVNRIGSDPNVKYNGRSVVYDPLGREILTMTEAETIQIVNLDCQNLQQIRNDLKFHKDADDFEIKL